MIDFLITPWICLPEGTTVPDHLFVIADIHGHADLLEAMLDQLEAQPAWAGHDRRLVFTGDLIDRGPQGFRAMNLANDAKTRFDHVSILCGNHEQMMLRALQENADPQEVWWWVQKCGGASLLQEMPAFAGRASLPIADFIAGVRAQLPAGYEKMLLSAPSHVVCGDLLMVHAGVTPLGDRRAFLAKETLDYSMHHWAWIRDNFLIYKGGWGLDHEPSRTIIVHGHTSEIEDKIRTEDELVKAVDRVADKKRINLDVGSYAYGHIAALEVRDGAWRAHLATRQVYLP